MIGLRSVCGFQAAYALQERIGCGAYGLVFAARRLAKDGPRVAVKVTSARDGLQREASLQSAVPPCEHVVQCLDFYSHGTFAYLVMEMCDLSLSAFLLQAKAMQVIFRDMLAGITACHGACIAHRDVKPGNFVVTCHPSRIKLCDFGLAARLASSEAEDLAGVVGTAPYMAPEMLGGSSYGVAVDVWALGAVAHVLLYGRYAFGVQGCSSAAMKEAILEGAPGTNFRSSPCLPKISELCAEWLRVLLRRAGRPSAREALAQLQAPWPGTASLHRAVFAAKLAGALATSDGKAEAMEREILARQRTDGAASTASTASTATPEPHSPCSSAPSS